MHYYEVALPVNISQLYIYRSMYEISRGCRVLVDFNHNLMTGFIWNKIPETGINPDIRYKMIKEVIDDKALLTKELLDIAKWISNYYFCSLGTVISAMLPAAIQLQIVQQIKKTDKSNQDFNSLSDDEQKILKELPDMLWFDIKEIANRLKKVSIYKHLEHLEEMGYIEVKRVYDAKIKSKFANYILLNQTIKELPSLTPKQQEAYNTIKNSGDEVPLAQLADIFSYSVIKALRTKELLTIEARAVKENLEKPKIERIEKKITLTDEQDNVLQQIMKSLAKKAFKPFLLYGITGSGKTEIYIRIIKECLAMSKNALVLVPEIALTPQMEEWFFNAFGENIAIVHSHKNDRERWEEWKRIKSGECRIVIGARSAIFSPLTNIGIIIVDEEHENSYKQDKAPRYNARDIAVLRAKYANAVILLGSATPSLESLNNVHNGKYTMLRLLKRPFNVTKPFVITVDMKEEENDVILSELLIGKIRERLLKKEQTLLLLNRRGYASYVLCMNCGKVHSCPKCDVSLIFHSESHSLMCHYCGYTEKMVQKCSGCNSYIISYGTAGTQQLEKQLHLLFPSAKILRMDADTVTKKDSYNAMFEQMKRGKVDILFGTQMIAKGLDFAKVTLVGVISADNSLNVPDFRASERTFQLLTQVAGRSGRGDFPGEVIIQTYNPEHYAITSAKEQDFDMFTNYELPLRKNSLYPPYVRIARIIFSHKDETTLKDEVETLKPLIMKMKRKGRADSSNKPLFEDGYDDDIMQLKILGPVPAPIHKINDRFRYHIIMKSPSTNSLFSTVKSILEGNNLSKSVKIDVDIDPLSLM